MTVVIHVKDRLPLYRASPNLASSHKSVSLELERVYTLGSVAAIQSALRNLQEKLVSGHVQPDQPAHTPLVSLQRGEASLPHHMTRNVLRYSMLVAAHLVSNRITCTIPRHGMPVAEHSHGQVLHRYLFWVFMPKLLHTVNTCIDLQAVSIPSSHPSMLHDILLLESSTPSDRVC